jgi:hypothetical protein
MGVVELSYNGRWSWGKVWLATQRPIIAKTSHPFIAWYKSVCVFEPYVGDILMEI